jgi:hypothetical protein
VIKKNQINRLNNVKEDVNLNPDMNIQGMNDVEFPGDPGSMNDFKSQSTGNSPINKKRKNTNLLSYSDFLDLLKIKK